MPSDKGSAGEPVRPAEKAQSIAAGGGELKRRGPARAVLAAALLVAAIGAFARWAGPLSTRLLLVSDPVETVDLIVVPAGGSAERVETAARLYRRGVAPAILVTDGQGFPDSSFRLLCKNGVPARALLAPPWPTASTLGDALAVRDVVVRLGTRHVLVVTSPYHTRRSRLIFRRVLADLGVQVRVAPSASLYMDWEHWWRTRQGWITVPQEIPKLVWAWASVAELRTSEALHAPPRAEGRR